MSLGVALMAVTGLIEVGLRNATCKHLDTSLGGSGWLRRPPNGLRWSAYEIQSIRNGERAAQRAIYSKMTSAEKADLDDIAFPNGVPQNIKHRKLAEKRQSSIIANDGQVIAQLTMFFWKRLFSETYEVSLWKRAIKRVFPNKTLDRSDVAAKLEVIYQVRNRLAHHEPVYGRRLEDALIAIEFVAHNLESRVPSSEAPFAKFILPQRDILSGQVAIFRTTFERLCG
ncbi:hypothetical protein [Paracoccus versutus]|uniref:hypothetical protein n=1 Tax=Paracoccus versutus TaxID=34007 RepID=UPI001FB70D91|nr:hypothetical protein [Paracoccus versutus]